MKFSGLEHAVTDWERTAMLHLRGLTPEQMAALLRLTEDNQSFEGPGSPRRLDVIEGGRGRREAAAPESRVAGRLALVQS